MSETRHDNVRLEKAVGNIKYELEYMIAAIVNGGKRIAEIEKLCCDLYRAACLGEFEVLVEAQERMQDLGLLDGEQND